MLNTLTSAFAAYTDTNILCFCTEARMAFSGLICVTFPGPDVRAACFLQMSALALATKCAPDGSRDRE